MKFNAFLFLIMNAFAGSVMAFTATTMQVEAALCQAPAQHRALMPATFIRRNNKNLVLRAH